MSKRSIVVVGSSNTDFIIKLDRIPALGETLIGGEFLTSAGGKGANQAVAAARAGGKVSLVAHVGRDMFGERAIAGFRKEDIDVRRVTRDREAASGAALVLVARDGGNCIAVASGSNSRLSPAHVHKARTLVQGASLLLLQLETPQETVEADAALAAAKGVMVILNPAPARELPDRLLRQVSVLTPNEVEAESLTGIKITDLGTAAKAAQALQRRGVPTVVLTLGARGALIADESGTRHIRGFKVKAVDTTAAGDVFNGALAVAHTEGLSLRDSVRFANAAAAISVTCLGAQGSAPNRLKIERFLKSH